jgi:hypothetical protein
MARQAIYKHLTLVDSTAYPDDPSAPIGTNEWNEEPNPIGMLGFTTQTIASATSITPTSSMLSVTGSTDVATIATTETNAGDLLWVTTTGSVTIKHGTGNINLISGADTTLDTDKPMILVRKGTDWYEYGGAPLASPTFTGTIGGVNMTLTGNLTVSGATTTINSTTLTVDDKNIELASTASPTDALADGGGITLRGTTNKTIIYTNATGDFDISENVDIATGKKFKVNGIDVFSPIDLDRVGSAPADPSANKGLVYVKSLDGNNDGIFIKIKKAGAYNEVQIA